MNLQQYTQTINDCQNNGVEKTEKQQKQYERNIEELQKKEILTQIEAQLLPKMNQALPFTTSPMALSNHTFSKILQIQRTYKKDPFLAEDLEKQYVSKFSEKLEKLTNTLYRNTTIIYPQIIDYLELLGNKRKQEEILRRITKNLKQKTLTCEDITWINQKNKGPPILLSQQTYKEHSEQAYTEAQGELWLELKNYK